MSDFVSESDSEDEMTNTHQHAEDEEKYTQLMGDFGGGWRKQIAHMMPFKPRHGSAKRVMHNFLDLLGKASETDAAYAKDHLAKSMQCKVSAIVATTQKKNPFESYADMCEFFVDPTEYHKEQKENEQQEADLPHLLKHFFVYSGGTRAPAEVLERHFKRCEQRFLRDYDWSEYFSAGPEYGVSVREREQHIVKARAHDEEQRSEQMRALASQLSALILISPIWLIILAFVPYARNLIRCENLRLNCDVKLLKRDKTDKTKKGIARAHPFRLVELYNSYNMGDPGVVMQKVSTDGKHSPVRLPTHRFLCDNSGIKVDNDLAWVREYPGDTATWTFDAPGVMFGVNIHTNQVNRILPCYNNQGKDGNDPCESIVPPKGGQLFAYWYRQKIRSHVNYTNLEMPLGVYFSDSFGPPRFQCSPQKWVKYDEGTVLFDNIPYRLALTFGSAGDEIKQNDQGEKVITRTDHPNIHFQPSFSMSS
jgi:hypothetical protein